MAKESQEKFAKKYASNDQDSQTNMVTDRELKFDELEELKHVNLNEKDVQNDDRKSEKLVTNELDLDDLLALSNNVLKKQETADVFKADIQKPENTKQTVSSIDNWLDDVLID
jgi:hypothetical protein